METTWKFPEQETTPPVQEYEDYEEYGSEYNQDQEYNLEDVNGAEPLVAVSQEPAQEEQESVYLDLTGYELTGYQVPSFIESTCLHQTVFRTTCSN